MPLGFNVYNNIEITLEIPNSQVPQKIKTNNFPVTQHPISYPN